MISPNKNSLQEIGYDSKEKGNDNWNITSRKSMTITFLVVSMGFIIYNSW